MRKYILFVLSILTFSCVKEKRDLDWIVGDWQRVNDDAGQSTFENWNWEKEETFTGIGFTLEEKDTVFIENLTLEKFNKKWRLVITGVHEEPTIFEVTSFDKKHFICENNNWDFPKKIHYTVENDTLKAVVSNDEIRIDFIFVKP